MKYICSVCGYVYDDEKEKIPFQSLPESWTCPVCKAPKSAFVPEKPVEKKKYVCSICGYIYDEEKEKIPFADLPDTWVCPLCGAPKSAFVLQKTEEKQKKTREPVELDGDLQELSPGELSILLSNLARGCEKQYREEEAREFRKLADWFDSVTPAEESASMEKIAEKILENLEEDYPLAEDLAKEVSDRGAQRALLWGLKVTRMQQAILAQYAKEGENFLSHTNIWVCTVCGFIYIGENPPELCPVCKVPSWKFEKMEGGKAQ